MYVNYKMVVDFARPNKSNTILVAEDDANSRNCLFTLLFDKAPFDMTGVRTAEVRALKPSGAIVIDTATIHMDEDEHLINELEYLLPDSLTNETGTVTLTITLADNMGARITSFEFYLKIRNALYNEDDYIDDDDMAGFRDLLNRTRAALARMEVMVQQDALPNPYPIRITVDNVEYEYNGSQMVEILMEEVAYIGAMSGSVEITEDDSAAAIAVRAAEEAEGYKDDCDDVLAEVTDIVNNFETQIPTATVTRTGNVSTIVITDKNGTTTSSIPDGEKGDKGDKGDPGEPAFLNDLLDVVVTTPTTNQVLKFDGINWVNSTGGAGGASDLDDLEDVTISSPTDGQVLKYDSVTSKWVNSSGGGTIPTDLDDLGDVSLTSPVTGDHLTFDGADWVNDNTEFAELAFAKVKVGAALLSASSPSSQLELIAGSNIIISADPSTNQLEIKSTGGGGGGASWGSISGTLSNQNDLKNALDAKADVSHTHTTSDITDLATALSAKQDVLIAGSNISIAADGKTINATDTTYVDATPYVSGLMSATDKTKLNGIATGAEVNVQSDWNQTDNTADDFVKNKPTIPAAQIQSDWNQTNNASLDYIKNKPTVPTTLAGLTGDVNISSPSNDQVLKYDSSSSKWVNGTAPSGSTTLSGLTDTNISSASNGQVLKYDSSSSKWINDLPDTFTPSVTQVNGKATFDNLDPSYGYDLYYDDNGATGSITVPTWAGTVTKTTGTTSGTIKLAYDITNGTDGASKWALRILR